MSNARLNKDPDRAYRGVLLRADEAAQLARDVDNQYADLCPHLGVFQNSGRTSDGGHWRSCLICAAIDETSPSPALTAARETAALIDQTEKREIALGWFMFGLALGVFVGWLL